MGKKPRKHSWPQAKKLCRLNQNDIAMAKSLGLGPDGLIRARPDPKQKWKLPVKYWIHELYSKRFGHILGEKPLPAPEPLDPEAEAEAARRFEEERYWDDYCQRNAEEPAPKRKPNKPPAATPARAPDASIPIDEWKSEGITYKGITEDDVPF